MIEAWKRKKSAPKRKSQVMTDEEFAAPARRPLVRSASSFDSGQHQDSGSDSSVLQSEQQQLDQRQQKKPKQVREKLMDYLARRNHSELELKQKLSRDYEASEIDAAITEARERGWISPPEEISERVAAELGRKKKGHRFINQFLRNKGLPAIAKDSDAEYARAITVVIAKLAKEGPFDFDEQKKIQRLLANRGFDDETIRRVTNSRAEN